MSMFRIGEWTVDPEDGSLRSDGRVTRLEPKVLAVLLVLVARRGKVVSSDMLLREAWPETHVAYGALARTISILRRAFGDRASGSRYIETVPKRGYRLIAAVEDVAASGHSDHPALVTPCDAAPVSAFNRPVLTCIVLAAAAVVLVLTRPGTGQTIVARSSGTFDVRLRHDTRTGNERAIVHYTQAIRRAPDSADAYAGLATALAFRANYLPNREHWTNTALATAKRAAAIEPANVAAIRARAIAQAQAGKLRVAALSFEEAIRLNPRDVASRTNLGRMRLASGRVADALGLFEQHVIALPHAVSGYSHLAAGLAVAGYPGAAGEAAQAALRIDARDVDAIEILARIDLLSGKLAAARTHLIKALEIDSECVRCVVQLGLVEQLAGNPAPAATRYREARAMAPQFAPAALRLAQLLRELGNAVEAESLLEEVEQAAHAAIHGGVETHIEPWQLAVTSAMRGNRDAALEWYRRAIEAGRRDWTWDRWDPALSSLHADPAFGTLHQSGIAQHHAASAVVERLGALLARSGFDVASAGISADATSSHRTPTYR